MRLIHTADWHLGRTLHGHDLTAAHEGFLDWLVDVVRTEQVDAVLISGDLYDRALPPVESVQLLDDALARLAESTTVVLTPGNHDSPARLGFGAGLFRDALHVVSDPRSGATPVVVPNAGGDAGLLVYALPYLNPDSARLQLAHWATPAADGAPGVIARSHQAVMSTVVAQVHTDLAERRGENVRRLPAVLMAHAFVQGGAVGDTERDLRVGGVDVVAADTFRCVAGTPNQSGSNARLGPLAQLDYVALGHLHNAQVLGEGLPGPQLRYSGAPLPFSVTERGHQKSVALVEFDDQGQLRSARPLATPVPHRLSEVHGTLDDVLGCRFEAQRDDWARVVVVGEQRPASLVQRVQQAFPNVLEVRFECTRQAAPITGVVHDAPDPLRVATEFVTQVSGTAPTDAELAVLRQAVEAANAQEASL